MAELAPWWSDPKVKDDTPVMAHTPDPTKYHYPDAKQSERMRFGVGGVVVPRARDDGVSLGFDGRHAGCVHVDPDAPDGGAVVDLTALNDDLLYTAFAQSNYPHEVYYHLKTVGATLEPQARSSPERPQEERSNNMVPAGSYIVPKSANDGTQFGATNMEPLPMMPPQPQQQPPLQQQPPSPHQQAASQPPAPPPQNSTHEVEVAPNPYYPPGTGYPPPNYGQPYYPPPVVVPPMPSELAKHMATLTEAVNSLVSAQKTVVPPLPAEPSPARRKPPALSTVPESQRSSVVRRAATEEESDEDASPRQTLRQVNNALEEPQDGFLVGFESLEMKFVKGPLPEKARVECFFEIPGGGTYAARYHAVVDSASCLALVYDTRYEDGNQFLPPDLGDQPMTVACPKQNKRWSVCSMGFHFNIGVLDVVVLVKGKEEASEYDLDDE